MWVVVVCDQEQAARGEVRSFGCEDLICTEKDIGHADFFVGGLQEVCRFNFVLDQSAQLLHVSGSGDIVGQGSTVPTGGTSTAGIALNPAGTRLYVSNFGSNSITVFTLSASGDIVGAGTVVSFGSSGPLDLVVNPAGTRLYATAFNSGNLTAFPLTASGDIAGPGFEGRRSRLEEGELAYLWHRRAVCVRIGGLGHHMHFLCAGR